MFSRVNPGGFGLGAKFTSTQANQLDIDHANALDKTVAGDTLSGFINITPGTGGIGAGLGGAVGVSTGNGIILSWNNGYPLLTVGCTEGVIASQNAAITSLVSKGILSTTVNGIAPFVAGGIGDGGIAGGIAATVARGISDGGVGGGIAPSVIGGITDGGISQGIAITASHGLATSGSGSIQLAAGASDWIRYASTRTVTKNIPLSPPGFSGALGTGWTSCVFATGPTLVGGATGNNVLIPLNSLFDGSVNGAVLTGAKLVYAIGSSHSGQPASPISFGLLKQPIAGGSSLGGTALLSGGPQNLPWPGSTAAYYSSGNVQQFTPANQPSETINLANNLYYMQLQDESSTNSIAGNLFLALVCTFTGIANSAPG